MTSNSLLENLKSVDKDRLLRSAARYNQKVAIRRIEHRANNRKSEFLVAQARITD